MGCEKNSSQDQYRSRQIDIHTKKSCPWSPVKESTLLPEMVYLAVLSKTLVGAIENSSFPYSQLQQKHSSSVPVIHLNEHRVFCQVNMT